MSSSLATSATGCSGFPQPATSGSMIEGATPVECRDPSAPPTEGGVDINPVILIPPDLEFQTNLYYSLPTSGSASGAPPVQINYSLDLTVLPANARIVSAQVTYYCGGVNVFTSSDDYGSGNMFFWSKAGIAALNAALATGALSVTATGSWTPPPATASFGPSLFSVWYLTPVVG